MRCRCKLENLRPLLQRHCPWAHCLLGVQPPLCQQPRPTPQPAHHLNGMDRQTDRWAVWFLDFKATKQDDVVAVMTNMNTGMILQ